MYCRRCFVPLVVVLLVVTGCAQVPTTPTPPALPTTAQAGTTTIVAVAPQQQEKKCCSIWEFLGVPQIFGGLQMIGTRIRSRLGSRFPGLEPRPPLLTITDPANLGPEASPAVQTAAEVKAEEDQAAQKAKAINYLATLGCGGCDRGIEEALLSALDDCTEEVRYAAAKAFRDLSGSPCAVCKTDSCCSEQSLKKLNKIAYYTKDGCYVEPSPRVRRMARLALNGCGGYVASVDPGMGLPVEGPSSTDALGPTMAPGQSVLKGGAFSTGTAIQTVSALAPINGLAPISNPVLAEVNGEPIYLSQVAPLVSGQLDSIHRMSGAAPADDVRRTVQQRELHRLIDRKLILQEARRNLSPQQISQVAYHTLVSPGRRPERILADSGQQQSIDEEELIKIWLQRTVKVNEMVSEQELDRHYHAHLADHQAPAQVRWESITVPPNPANSAYHASAVIRYLHGVAQGRPVSPAPVFQSQDVVTRTFPLTRLDRVPSQRLANLLMSLPIGRVSEPWQDEQGWHLTRVLERRAAETLPLQQVRESVRAAIVQQRRELAERQYVEQLRRQARLWNALPGGAPGEPIATGVPVPPSSQAAQLPNRW